jgi:SAM-dependent methyltransferase
MSNADQIKAQAQSRFGQYAQVYVHSPLHAVGDDLERLAALVGGTPAWRVLDIATGGGHTALRLSREVGQVIAADLTPTMLHAAREYIQQQGATNVHFSAADAEAMPFADESFEAVTCRIAPHHFPDVFRFVQECARVLKPGGVLVVEDLLVPDAARAARYLDSFERLRDPSHHRMFANYEWRGLFLDAGLQVEAVEHILKRDIHLLKWCAMQGCSAAVIERMHILLAQAPPVVRDWLHPRAVGTPEAIFDHHYILIKGHKSI